MKTASTKFCDDNYQIHHNGHAWECATGQTPHVRDAMRAELRYSVRESGDNPDDYQEQIEQAIADMVIE